MAELGLIAAVVQVVDVGLRLSGKFYQFGQTVASADDSIVFISKDIDLTCSILKTLKHSLEKDREAHLYSENDINTAETIVNECSKIFEEMDGALLKKIKRIGLDGSSSRFAVVALERLKWPFLRPKIMLLWSNLGKLKSSLHLLLGVLSHARPPVERTEEPSVVNDQRNMIEDLLRTTAEHSRKFESLKAAIDRNGNLEVAGDSTNGHVPVKISLDAAWMPTEGPNKSKIKKQLEAPETDTVTGGLENYCALMDHLMAEVETEEYHIGNDMRSRIREDVIHTHMRETRLLRAVHGHTEVQEKMREKSWRLVEMAEERADEGKGLQLGLGIESSPRFDSTPCEDRRPQSLDPNPSQWSPTGEIQEQVGHFEWPPGTFRMKLMDTNARIESFLKNQDDPWNPFHLLREAPIVAKPRAAEENGWFPFWRSGASMLGFNRILPSNPSNSQLPFLRSGTSMLVTEDSHDVDSIASSQDLAALTDSTDTDTYASARSEIGEIALGSYPLCKEQAVKDGPLAIIGDQGYGDPAGIDGGRLAVASPHTSLDELLANGVIST